jgi:hypothetical protein
MPKLKINEIPNEERLIFLKKIKKKDFEISFDNYFDELELLAKKRGYFNNELKFINDGRYVNVYVLITLEI